MAARKHRLSEHDEQVAVIQWARVFAHKWPGLALLHAIPNGGSRNKREAVRLKAEGVLPGVPDLFLPVARGTQHGLYIEMKHGRNQLTSAQKAVSALLRRQGYAVIVCYEADEAISAISNYIKEGSEDG